MERRGEERGWREERERGGEKKGVSGRERGEGQGGKQKEREIKS